MERAFLSDSATPPGRAPGSGYRAGLPQHPDDECPRGSVLLRTRSGVRRSYDLWVPPVRADAARPSPHVSCPVDPLPKVLEPLRSTLSR